MSKSCNVGGVRWILVLRRVDRGHGGDQTKVHKGMGVGYLVRGLPPAPLSQFARKSFSEVNSRCLDAITAARMQIDKKSLDGCGMTEIELGVQNIWNYSRKQRLSGNWNGYNLLPQSPPLLHQTHGLDNCICHIPQIGAIDPQAKRWTAFSLKMPGW